MSDNIWNRYEKATKAILVAMHPERDRLLQKLDQHAQDAGALGPNPFVMLGGSSSPVHIAEPPSAEPRTIDEPATPELMHTAAEAFADVPDGGVAPEPNPVIDFKFASFDPDRGVRGVVHTVATGAAPMLNEHARHLAMHARHIAGHDNNIGELYVQLHNLAELVVCERLARQCTAVAVSDVRSPLHARALHRSPMARRASQTRRVAGRHRPSA